jgi:hypothetical protein
MTLLLPPPLPPSLYLQNLACSIRCASPASAATYSPRTAKSYTFWVKRYVLFHGKRHPRELGAKDLTAFLNHLASVGKVSASTQAQAH